MNLLNIKNLDIVVIIQESIAETRERLKGLDYNQTCKIYSGLLFEILKSKGVLVHLMNTRDFGNFYEHIFLLAFDGNNYYLIDLTYRQFNDEYLNDLYEKGFMLVNQISYNYYLKIVTNNMLHLDLNDSFTSNIRK